MLIAENWLRRAIRQGLMRRVLKEGVEGRLFKIPKLPRGYYDLYRLLLQEEGMSATGHLSSVNSLRKLYQDKFLFVGDQIDLDEVMSSTTEVPKIYSYKSKGKDVFEQRPTVEEALRQIRSGHGIKDVAQVKTQAAVIDTDETETGVDDKKSVTTSSTSQKTPEASIKKILKIADQKIKKINQDKNLDQQEKNVEKKKVVIQADKDIKEKEKSTSTAINSDKKASNNNTAKESSKEKTMTTQAAANLYEQLDKCLTWELLNLNEGSVRRYSDARDLALYNKLNVYDNFLAIVSGYNKFLDGKEKQNDGSYFKSLQEDQIQALRTKTKNVIRPGRPFDNKDGKYEGAKSVDPTIIDTLPNVVFLHNLIKFLCNRFEMSNSIPQLRFLNDSNHRGSFDFHIMEFKLKMTFDRNNENQFRKYYDEIRNNCNNIISMNYQISFSEKKMNEITFTKISDNKDLGNEHVIVKKYSLTTGDKVGYPIYFKDITSKKDSAKKKIMEYCHSLNLNTDNIVECNKDDANVILSKFLKDKSGQKVLMLLTANWCIPCKTIALPEILNFKRENPSVNVVIFDVEYTTEDAAKFIPEFDVENTGIPQIYSCTVGNNGKFKEAKLIEYEVPIYTNLKDGTDKINALSIKARIALYEEMKKSLGSTAASSVKQKSEIGDESVQKNATANQTAAAQLKPVNPKVEKVSSNLEAEKTSKKFKYGYTDSKSSLQKRKNFIEKNMGHNVVSKHTILDNENDETGFYGYPDYWNNMDANDERKKIVEELKIRTDVKNLKNANIDSVKDVNQLKVKFESYIKKMKEGTKFLLLITDKISCPACKEISGPEIYNFFTDNPDKYLFMIDNPDSDVIDEMLRFNFLDNILKQYLKKHISRRPMHLICQKDKGKIKILKIILLDGNVLNPSDSEKGLHAKGDNFSAILIPSSSINEPIAIATTEGRINFYNNLLKELQ